MVESPALNELVELARAGDEAAFEAIMRDRTDAMYRLSLAITGNETDAADAFQEALVGAWRHLPGLRETERFDAWLNRIVVNSCRMTVRSRSRRRVHEIAFDGIDHAASPDRTADVDLLRLALRRLTPDRREILALHYFEDRPLADIAEILAIPTGTAKSRLFHARAALVRALAEEDRR